MRETFTQELIRQVEAEGLLPAPVHMKQEILKRSRRVDYQLAVQSRKLSQNTQLFFYGLKVGTAMATALFLLFAVPKELPRVDWQATKQVQEEWMTEGELSWEMQESLGMRVNAGLSEIDQMLTNFVKWETVKK